MAFAFEELNVYKRALDFSVSVINIIEDIDTSRKHYRLIEQLESASTSVSLNISEGKDRYSKKKNLSIFFIFLEVPFMKQLQCSKKLSKGNG